MQVQRNQESLSTFQRYCWSVIFMHFGHTQKCLKKTISNGKINLQFPRIPKKFKTITQLFLELLFIWSLLISEHLEHARAFLTTPKLTPHTHTYTFLIFSITTTAMNLKCLTFSFYLLAIFLQNSMVRDAKIQNYIFFEASW